MKTLLWGVLVGALLGIWIGWSAGRYFQVARRAYGDYRGTVKAVPKMRRTAWDAAVRSAGQVASIGGVALIAIVIMWKVS